MTERNRCGCADEGLGMDAASGVTPPLLPTLLMALVLGAASLLCREPEAPVPASTAAVSTAMVPRIAAAPVVLPPVVLPPIALATEAGPTFVPAALAFPNQFPLVVAAVPASTVAQAPHRSAAPRVASLRRPVAAKAAAPTVETPLHGEPTAQVAKAAMPAESGDLLPDLSLPDLALPFAPAIRAVGCARDFVGMQGAAARTQATALGGAVVDFVGTLR